MIEIFPYSINDVLNVLRISSSNLTVIVDYETDVFKLLMRDLTDLSRATKEQFELLIELVENDRLIFKQANVVSGTEYLVLNNKAFKNVEVKPGRNDWGKQTVLTQKQLLNKVDKAVTIQKTKLIANFKQIEPLFNDLENIGDVANQFSNVNLINKTSNSKKYKFTSSIVFTNIDEVTVLSEKLEAAINGDQSYRKLIEPYTAQIKRNDSTHLLKVIVRNSKENTTKLLFNTPIYILKVSVK